nr:MAG TPA_asm: hypothetical protein [Caudoviricetes sp.]
MLSPTFNLGLLDRARKRVVQWEREISEKKNHTYHPCLRAGATRLHRGVCLHAFAYGLET